MPEFIHHWPELTDVHERRARAEATMSRHRDPLVRELGLQLGRGLLVPRDVLRAPAYRGLIEEGLRHLRELDARRGPRSRPRPADPA
jgi:hypothetical protein